MKVPETHQELQTLSKNQLPQLWAQITRNSTKIPTRSLLRPLWYHIQCNRHKCHLDQKHITRLNKYAKNPDEHLKVARSTKYELMPGTLIRKTYKGQLFTLRVIDNNQFEYNGKTYKSLSAAAKAMIGMKVSGTDFFGLTNKNKPEAL